MADTVVKVKGVKVFESDNAANVELTFDKEVKGYKKGDDDTFTLGTTKKVSFFRSALTAQLCELDDDFALYRAMQEHSLGQRELALILFNAKLTLKQEEHTAGEEVTINGRERTIERDCIFTSVTKVEFTERAVNAMNDSFTLLKQYQSR